MGKSIKETGKLTQSIMEPVNHFSLPSRVSVEGCKNLLSLPVAMHSQLRVRSLLVKGYVFPVKVLLKPNSHLLCI